MIDALHNLSLGDLLREGRRRYRSATAIVSGDIRLTYPELDDRVTRLASSLTKAGIGGGDRIAWIGQTSHQVVELLFAAAKVGAMLCPVNWRLSPDEMGRLLSDFDPAMVFWQEEEVGDAARAGRDMSRDTAVWLQADHDDAPCYESFLADGHTIDDERLIDPMSPVLVIYTAAFGGAPHGALLHHHGLISTAVVRGFLSERRSDSVYLNATNFYHVGNWDFGTLPTIVFGGTNVFLRRWDARLAARLIEDEHVDLCFLAGPMYESVREAAAELGADISTLRTPSGAAAKIGGYGQTELHGVQTFQGWARSEGTHGRISPFAQLRLLDEDGQEVPDGEVGEIVVRGPVVMGGYLNRPELNANANDNGWRRCNDLGRREADGSITFVGPKMRMLKSGSENIYPIEVEQAISSHPAVRRVAVIGVPDERWDQSVVAIVELHDGDDVDAAVLIEHCRAQVASYKKPRIVEFVDALPMLNGRVDYEELDRRFGGGGYPGSVKRAAQA